MKEIFPSYYPEFRCIAGACRHSCCIGWEIDIDPLTADFYKSAKGTFGNRLQDNIDFEEDIEYAKEVLSKFEEAGIRVELDERQEKIGYKIREAQLQKIPYMLIVGEKEAADNKVSLLPSG